MKRPDWKLLINLQDACIRFVAEKDMETLPMGTLLYCNSDQLRRLADLMDQEADMQEIRDAAICTGRIVRPAWTRTSDDSE